MENALVGRKADHIRIAVNENVRSSMSNGLEKYRLKHSALPDIDYEVVDLRTEFFGKSLSAPLLISSMTGGTKEALEINHSLAKAAQKFNIALGVGSQRAGIERADLMQTFQVRKVAPDVLLFANLGAVQLNYGYSIDHYQKAVDSIEANALILHLNPLQEALQPEGDTRYSGLLNKIEMICNKLTVPVIVKEVGWGISGEVALLLQNVGVKAIDVAGAGGTSWSQVEKYRISDPYMADVANDFVNWGIPTAECLISVRAATPKLPIIASGGLMNGIDAVKCIALGAKLTGFAGKLIKPAVISYDALELTINAIIREMRIAMFACGVEKLEKIPMKIERVM